MYLYNPEDDKSYSILLLQEDAHRCETGNTSKKMCKLSTILILILDVKFAQGLLQYAKTNSDSVENNENLANNINNARSEAETIITKPGNNTHNTKTCFKIWKIPTKT